MKKLQIWYIKFGCFLTGYDFYTLSNCSEVAVRKVKKYTAALIIISIVWAIVGFTFSSRYLKLGTIGCIIGALTSLVLVIQIERQILMVSKTNWKILWARGLLALLMAVIGSLIIDQMIFKEDIDKRKLRTNQEEVDRILPQRTKELDKQIARTVIDNDETLAVKLKISPPFSDGLSIGEFALKVNVISLFSIGAKLLKFQVIVFPTILVRYGIEETKSKTASSNSKETVPDCI